MNYQIDHQREAVIPSIQAGDLAHLLVHDQLIREMKSNRVCRLRTFSEGTLTFSPTYKHDRHSDEYDRHLKSDGHLRGAIGILWRAQEPSRVQQVHYGREEVNLSDHRPIWAAFQGHSERVRW